MLVNNVKHCFYNKISIILKEAQNSYIYSVEHALQDNNMQNSSSCFYTYKYLIGDNLTPMLVS